MQLAARLTQLATSARLPLANVDKHDTAATVLVVVALALFIRAGMKLVLKAAGALLLFFVALGAVVVAALLFTRTI
jgi:hypothetical protein